MATPYVILHIPHSSRVVPAHVRDSLCLSDEDLDRELLVLTDHYTREIFDCQDDIVHRVVFPVSRLVLDPERFLDDALEPMARHGMGVVYTRTSGGKPLRGPLFRPTRAELIEELYVPHHNRLTTAVKKSLRDNRFCLILDCHSFPMKPFPYEPHAERPRPEICLGTDPSHTPGWLIREARSLFEREGFRVAIDYPFWGTMVPSRYHEKDPSVLGLMIEVNRSLYMDEASGEKHPGFPDFRETLSNILNRLIALAGRQAGPALI